VLEVEDGNQQAALAKAKCLRILAQSESNPNHRNYNLTYALELEGKYKGPDKLNVGYKTIAQMPVEVIIQAMPTRIDYEKAKDKTMCIVFEFTDLGKSYTFNIRKGIGEVLTGKHGEPDLVFTATEKDFKGFIIGEMNPVSALSTGKIKAQGGMSNLLKFQNCMIQM